MTNYIFGYPMKESNEPTHKSNEPVKMGDMSSYIVSIPITLQNRGDDWRAYVTDKPEYFVSGISPSDVLDRLIKKLGLQ